MMLIISIILVSAWLAAIFALSHMIVGKFLGFQVNEITIGFGPKLFSIILGHTKFAVKLFPISSSTQTNMNQSRPGLRTLLFTLTGPLTMWFLSLASAWVVLQIGVEQPISGAAVVHDPGETELKKSDKITKIAGKETHDGQELCNLLKSQEKTSVGYIRDAAYHETILYHNTKIKIIPNSQIIRYSTSVALREMPSFVWNSLWRPAITSYHRSVSMTWRGWNQVNYIIAFLSLLFFFLGLFNMLPLSDMIGGQVIIIFMRILSPRADLVRERVKTLLDLVTSLIIVLLAIMLNYKNCSTTLTKDTDPCWSQPALYFNRGATLQ